MENFDLHSFCRLVLKFGVNLQKNQGIEIACPVERKETAEIFAEEAFKLNASTVRVRWEDEIIDRLNFINADKDVLTDVPKWFVESKNDLLERNFCYVAIAAEDPSAFKDVPTEKLAAYSRARSLALKRFSSSVMSNGIRWCVVSVPTEKWAKQVFPESENSIKDLSESISKTMRLNNKNPEKAWEEHIRLLDSRAEFLNKNDFAALKFSNSLGTDLTVGLADGHKWLSAKEKAKDGIDFIANMPTEEVFTAPHMLRTDGKVFSAMPLSYNGQIIDNFSLTFKKGKVVDFSAEKGYELLKELIETDGGTKRLGEVALIGKNSPIAKSKTLFYNTLFDENASCHLALGKAYPTTVRFGEKMSLKELKNAGVNHSVEHVDFMIGTPDLEVSGIKKDGKTVRIFTDGDWDI